MKSAFDAQGNFTLTDAEVNQILERFDQTPEPLQRRIVASFACRAKEATDFLKEVISEVGFNVSEHGRHEVPPDLCDRIARFI